MTDKTLALEFNNLGVICLDEGNRREAMNLFKGASQLMTHLVAQGEESDAVVMEKAMNDPRVNYAHAIYSEYIADGYSEHIEGCYDTCSPMLSGNSSSMDILVDILDSGSSSKSFICKRAIRLTQELLPSDWTQSVAVCCSVVLYNMALVYHLAAADSVLESSGQKALNLYEMAFTLLSDQNFEADSTLIGRLMMYCLNNMASLNFELTKWELSTECMKRLTILATLMQSKGVGGRSLHEECQSFLLNAMVLKTPTRAPAA